MGRISEYTTQDSGHSDLAAGMCEELKIAETTDRLSPPTEIYASAAAQSCLLSGLKPRFAHMDSTSFHTDGRYNSDHAPEEGVIQITKGYSRDHRPERTECFLRGDAASCLDKRAETVSIQGMSVLATNELDEKRLPAPDVLAGYKGQSHVEKGFRFLKNPEFLADSLFLKKTERIMAPLMIMTICLMVYAALEYRIRQGLQRQGNTVTCLIGKPTDRPAARQIFHCFTGIHILYHNGRFMGIINLNGDHLKIINLLGYHAYYQ